MIKNFALTLWEKWLQTPIFLQILFLFTFIISVYLAIVGLHTGIIFSFDQARDAIEAKSIWHDHHLKILGPGTDIPGVFHGVLWYYLLAVVYFIVRAPEFVAAVFCIFLFLTVPFVGLLAEELFRKREITIISMALYVLSPIFQTSSRWLSNPIPSFLISPILLILIWNYIKKPQLWVAFVIAVCYGIIIQADSAYVLLLLTIPVFWIIFRFRATLKDISAFIVGLLLSLSSFFIAEIKFHEQGIKGMIVHLQKGTPHHSLLITLSQIWDRLSELLLVTFSPFPKQIISLVLFTLIALTVISFFKKDKKPVILLSVWLGILVIFLLSGTGIATSYFLFFPFVSALVILVSYLLVNYMRITLLITVFVLVFAYAEIMQSQFYINSNTSPLPAQQGATLNYEKQIISYTYEAAEKKPFTIVTITNPLYINTTWAYLYNQYGLSKYNYVPNYGGRGQTNLPGENLLPEIPFGTHFRYLIIEPPDGLATIYVTKITYEEDKVSDIVETKHIGRYIVQKRILHDHKTPPPIPQELQGKAILYE